MYLLYIDILISTLQTHSQCAVLILVTVWSTPASQLNKYISRDDVSPNGGWRVRRNVRRVRFDKTWNVSAPVGTMPATTQEKPRLIAFVRRNWSHAESPGSRPSTTPTGRVVYDHPRRDWVHEAGRRSSWSAICRWQKQRVSTGATHFRRRASPP